MQFNPKDLGNRFESTVDRIISGQFGQEIKNSLKTYQQQKDDLSNDADAESALRLLLYTKVTNSLAREMSASGKQQFDGDLDSFLVKHKQNLRTPQAMDELIVLIVNYSKFKKISEPEAKKWVEKLLGDFPNLKDFTGELYKLRKKGKNSLLGDKGADHYLRNFGFFDIVPIDLHERRFLVRTGIFHAFSVPGRQDPLDGGSLQDALSTLCTFYLKDKMVENIDLGSNPGVVDLFIWFYCSDNKYDICGSTPKCEECQLNDACLYSLASIQNAIAKGQTMQEYGLSKEGIDQLLQQVQSGRPTKQHRIKWSPIRQWAQNDPSGLALSLKKSGMSRSAARAFLKRAGLTRSQIDKYYP